MANIYGYRHYTSGRFLDNFADTLNGTSSADNIYGYGGDDSIYGGLGNDFMYGGSGNDYIAANSNGYWGIGNWGNDSAWGGSGNDTLDFARNTARVELYGEANDDTLWGGTGNDYLNGGSESDKMYGGGGADYMVAGTGNDFVYGGDGVDWIWGESGSDYLHGGAGNDWLSGGVDLDTLAGSTGSDTFAFFAGDTMADSTHDIITDWNPAEDWIDAAVAGTSTNYAEKYVAYGSGFYAARDVADVQLKYVDYVFVTDSVNGYLFGDTDGNGWADTAIQMNGANSLDSFAWSDII